MALESFFTRWRKAVRPLPRDLPDAALLVQRRRQRNLIHRTAGLLLLAFGGSLLYNFITRGPDRARAEGALGIQKMAPGTYAEAIRHFDRAIQIWPEYAEAYLNRGIAEHDVNQKGPALADLEKALDLDPSLTRAADESGQIYLEYGNPKMAILALTNSIQVKPTLEGYSQRGEAYEKLGEHHKAIADFDAAIAEFREAPYTYRARAVAKRKIGDRAGAQADEDRAQRIEDGRPVGNDVLATP